MPRFNLDDYVDVQSRITRFWSEYPDGRIRTDLMSTPDKFDQVVFVASVFKHRDHPSPDATGWAAEKAGGGGANATSWHENGETSAIGRALANLGYATSQRDRPSREEMAKANQDAPQARQPRDERRYGHLAPDAAQRQMNPANAGEPATANQIKTIFGAGKHTQNWTPDQTKQWVAENFGGKHIDDLTRAEASQVIDHLNEPIQG